MTDSSAHADREVAAEGPTQVTVTIPADPARLPILRSVAAALAVSLDFDIDTMADLRMAVDEVGSTVVTRARRGGQVQVDFVADGDAVTVRARVAAADATPIDEGSFGWMVLTTLAESVTGTVEVADGAGPEMRVSLTVRADRIEQ